MQWVLAAILVCGASVFTSCSSDNDDNPVINPDEPQQQLADYTIIYCSRWDRYLSHSSHHTQVPVPATNDALW